MKEAFTYMLKDNKIKEKAALYFGIMFIATLLTNFSQYINSNNSGTVPSLASLLLGLIGGILSLITTGYSFVCIKTIIEQKDNIVLPYIAPKNAILGLKFSVSILMLVIAGYICFIPALMLGYFSSSIITVIFAFAFIAFLAAFSVAFAYIFATTEMWTSCFRFKRAFQIIKQNKWQYWRSLLLVCAISIAAGILTGIVAHFSGHSISGTIIETLFSSAVASYTVFVMAYLIAVAVKQEEQI